MSETHLWKVCQIYEDPITKQKPEGVAVLWTRSQFESTFDEPFQDWNVSFVENGKVEQQQVTRMLDKNDIIDARVLP